MSIAVPIEISRLELLGRKDSMVRGELGADVVGHRQLGSVRDSAEGLSPSHVSRTPTLECLNWDIIPGRNAREFTISR
jgi:hypothetical protein